MAGERLVVVGNGARRSLVAVFALTAASLLASAGAAQKPADTRGVAAVPAPIGPEGQILELYKGSYALLVGVTRYDTPAWSALPSVC
jgi:hypothetical protein